MLDATATAHPTQSDFDDSAPESSHGIAPVVMGAEQAKVESNAPEERAPDSSSANPVTSLPQVAAVAAAPSGAELGAAQTLVDANQWRAAVIAEYDAAVRASGAAVAAAPGGVPQHRPPPYALVGGFESSFDDEDMDDPAAAYDFSNGGQLSEASSRHSSGRISERAPADAVEAEAEEGEEEEYEEEEAGAYGQAMPYDMGAHYDAAGYGAALQPHYAAAAAHAAAAAAAAAAGGGVLATSGRAQKRAWTQEEDAIILDGVKTFGHKWSKITERLPVSAAHRHAARRPPTPRRPPPVTRGTPQTLTVPLFPTLRCRAPTIPSATAGSACCASRRSRGSRRAAPTATARPPWRRRASTTAAAAAARTRAGCATATCGRPRRTR